MNPNSDRDNMVPPEQRGGFKPPSKGQQKVKILPKFSSDQVVDKNLKYVDDRRNGRIKSLTTKFPRLNKHLMGGIELDCILAISAMSGAGKSTLSKCIRDSIYDLNKEVDNRQYVFNFEMLAHQQIGRSVVTKSNKSMKELYSIDEPLTDEQFVNLKIYYDDLRTRDIWFIETADTAKTIADSLIYYWKTECQPYGKVMVYEIDHALLTKGNNNQGEKERVDDLMYRLVDVKKYISANDGHSVGIVLSQMNRIIRGVDRIANKEMHRPDTSCLFGASSIEQCSDYILFAHIPAKLGIKDYGVSKYPTVINVGTEKLQIPYFELVKNRSGEPDITIPMWNKLSRFDFDEMDMETFKNLHNQHLETGECYYNPQHELKV